MEIWDGYRIDGSLAGVDIVRGEPIPRGIYFLMVEILVRHTDGDYLLMHRDTRKKAFAGYLEATAGGAALKGEDPYTAALRELKEETGITPADYLAILRLEYAKEQLVQSDESLTEIASDLNFSSASHFCSAFKKRTSYTPKEYRRRHVNEGSPN